MQTEKIFKNKKEIEAFLLSLDVEGLHFELIPGSFCYNFVTQKAGVAPKRRQMRSPRSLMGRYADRSRPTSAELATGCNFYSTTYARKLSEARYSCFFNNVIFSAMGFGNPINHCSILIPTKEEGLVLFDPTFRQIGKGNAILATGEEVVEFLRSAVKNTIVAQKHGLQPKEPNFYNTTFDYVNIDKYKKSQSDRWSKEDITSATVSIIADLYGMKIVPKKYCPLISKNPYRADELTKFTEVKYANLDEEKNYQDHLDLINKKTSIRGQNLISEPGSRASRFAKGVRRLFACHVPGNSVRPL